MHVNMTENPAPAPKIPKRQRNKIDAEEWEFIKKLRLEVAEQRRQKEAVEPDRGPLPWAYIRCSHQDSMDSGLGIEAQRRMVSRWLEFVREKYPDLGNLRMLEEEKAISAYKIPLIRRPAGKILHQSLRAGDHVIFAYLDRVWRNTEDCLATLRLWKERGVIVHFANMHIDTNTAMGEFFITIMAASAKMDSAMKSERIKEVFRGLRAQGRLNCGPTPIGFKLIRRGKHRAMVPDVEARKIMAEVVRVRDKHGWKWADVSDYIEKWLAGQYKRKYNKPWEKRKWSAQRCRRVYLQIKEMELKAETAPDAAEPTEPQESPPSLTLPSPAPS